MTSVDQLLFQLALELRPVADERVRLFPWLIVAVVTLAAEWHHKSGSSVQTGLLHAAADAQPQTEGQSFAIYQWTAFHTPACFACLASLMILGIKALLLLATYLPIFLL